MRYGYPVVLDLENKACVVFGDGRQAKEKVEGLRAAGASVRWIERDYRPGDLAGCFLAVVATGSRESSAAIFAEAERAGVLINVLDDPAHCRFVFPSIHRQGDLVIAVSTTGKCPALAVRLRERFQKEFGPEYAEFLRLARDLRERIASTTPDFPRRRRLWYWLVDTFLRGAEERKEQQCPTLLARSNN